MITIHRAAGLRFQIYTNDHEPAHVHVFANGEARINIRTGEVISNRGMKRGDLATALRLVGERKDEFLKEWTKHHG